MKATHRLNLSLGAAAAWLLVVGTGCNRDSVKTYHADASDAAASIPAAPVATDPVAMPATMPAGLPAPDNSGLPPLKYVLPAGWEEKKPTEMRVASFGIKENGKLADVSVVPLGGLAGGDFANVNRWRGQVGLSPLGDGELHKLAEPITIGGQPADLYDVGGSAPGSGDSERIVGAILHQNDTAWFFKMAGDGGVVEKQKPVFIQFLKTLEFGGLPAPSTMDLSKLPPSHPVIPGMDAAAPAADAASTPKWTVPAGWTTGPLTQFLIAKFLIAGDNGAQASVNVSSLDGDGGGLAPNLNRWRGQLGLPPTDEILTTPLTLASGQGNIVELSGTDGRTGKPAALVGVVVPENGTTWFYKLMGDTNLVTAQKDRFFKFIQSAKYPNAH